MSNIEEDIKRCEQLIKPEHANWIGISNQLAIAHLIEKIKELEEQVEYDITHIITPQTIELNYVPKQKVREGLDKIEDYFYRLNGPDEDIEYIRNIKKELLEEK